jgi:hypothetical protein
MRFAIISSAAVALALLTSPASAAIIVNNIAYNDAAAPTGPFVSLPDGRFSQGMFQTGSSNGVYAQPAGSSGLYWSVGPTGNGPSPGYLDTTGLRSISFLWGSVDDFNKIDFLDAGNHVLASITGLMVGPPANGDQGAPSTNRYVTLNLQDSSLSGLAKLSFSSTSNAFETANYMFSAVPESSTWAMMILGIGLIGGVMRRRARTAVTYNFA